jgi:hypothetical protein
MMNARHLLLSTLAVVELASADASGHAKLRWVGGALPGDSALLTTVGDTTSDTDVELRGNLALRRGRWSFDAAAQFIDARGDLFRLTQGDSALVVRLPGDDRRAFDLTHTLSESSHSATVARLDRFAVAYSSGTMTVTLGRQALTWGGGFAYTPLDLVNPFGPAVIDAEFKPGDDLLHVQRLLDNGAQVEVAAVARRVPGRAVSSSASSYLTRYRGFAGALDVEVLAGRHYAETVVGAGIGGDLRGTAWRSDLLLTDAASGLRVQWIANATRAWQLGTRNATSFVELYYNGFGTGGDVTAATLPAELRERLVRGDGFALGRRHVAAGTTVEWTPLFVMNAAMLLNLDQPAALLQLGGRYSAAQNVDLLFTATLPAGPTGSEYRGLRPAPGLPAATIDATLFLQLAAYF